MAPRSFYDFVCSASSSDHGDLGCSSDSTLAMTCFIVVMRVFCIGSRNVMFRAASSFMQWNLAPSVAVATSSALLRHIVCWNPLSSGKQFALAKKAFRRVSSVLGWTAVTHLARHVQRRWLMIASTAPWPSLLGRRFAKKRRSSQLLSDVFSLSSFVVESQSQRIAPIQTC